MQELADTKLAQVVDGYFRGLAAAEIGDWLELFADDAVSHDPVGASPAEGKRAIEAQWRVLRSQFDSLRFSLDYIAYAGICGAAVKWTGTGSAADRRTVRFEGIHVFELAADGTIATVMAYWDPAATLLELAGEAPS